MGSHKWDKTKNHQEDASDSGWSIAGYGPTAPADTDELRLAEACVAVALMVAKADGDVNPEEIDALPQLPSVVRQSARTPLVREAAGELLRFPWIVQRVSRSNLAAPLDAFRPVLDRLPAPERGDVALALWAVGKLIGQAHEDPTSLVDAYRLEVDSTIGCLTYLGITKEEILEADAAQKASPDPGPIEASRATGFGDLPTPQAHRQPLRLPPEVFAALESAGVKIVADPQTGAQILARNGITLARIDSDPPHLTWSDPAFEAFSAMVFEYERAARLLQENRGFDTIGLRDELRGRLQLTRLLDLAEAARCRVEKRGGLRAKEYFVWHPAFEEFVRFTVLRGTSHVVDVAFASPPVVVLLSFLHGFQEDLARIGLEGRSNSQTSEAMTPPLADAGRRSAPDALSTPQAGPPTDLRRVRASNQRRVERYLALLSAKVGKAAQVGESLMAEWTDEEIRTRAKSAPVKPGFPTGPAIGEFVVSIRRSAQAQGEAAPLLRSAHDRWSAGNVAGAASSFEEARRILLAHEMLDQNRLEEFTWTQARSTNSTRAELQRLHDEESSDEL
ncbi:MAG: hypothetical protein HYX57_11905 [Chloroflexi bacterium]|nr:hypothetical protein [Chloroflexota bacterium]